MGNKLDTWLNEQLGITVSPSSGGTLVVGTLDWRLAGPRFAYAPAFGDRLHIHHLTKVERDGEDWRLVSKGGAELRLGYIWTPEERLELDRWAVMRPIELDEQLERAVQDAV